ncbi:restriction endonuclease [Stenomitos frigidus]|uniref:Restriction endonuclease n=1 Tax=Stenomitos frigidus ULC18 TaxID=2107698 RepID=A0A2T1DU58_9CYAN|nr:restriction endonuclease [Stenomitos frigidus]PSB24020.1 restriction endonuclease [Stenomitos frigidus ULC18]
MSLPTYDQFMLPLLKLAAEDERVHAIATLREQLAHQFGITPEQRAIRLPNGQQSVFDNRIGWANTYLRKAGLLSRPKRGSVQITQRGRDVLAENPTAIDNLYLQRFDEFREFRERSATEEPLATTPNATPASTTTPEETISKAIGILNPELRDELLDKVKQLAPEHFEGLVLRLLHAMGYGGSLKDVEGVPRGPDGGIDGTIKEDKLGLDVIYIQAKRWENSIGREKIQAFQGALAGVGARKGVFITTSTYTQQAIAYAAQLRDSKIILIDGQKLTQFMIEHDVGVSIKETFHLKRLDEDFFADVDF